MRWTVEQVRLMGRLRRSGITEEKLVQLYREFQKFESDDIFAKYQSAANSDVDQSLSLEDINDPVSFGTEEANKSNGETYSSVTYHISQAIHSPIERYDLKENVTFNDTPPLVDKSERERQMVSYQQQLANMTRDLFSVERELNEKVASLERKKSELQMKAEQDKNKFNLEMSRKIQIIKEKEATIEELRANERRLIKETKELTAEKDNLETKLKGQIDESNKMLSNVKNELNDANVKKQEITEDRNFLLIQLSQSEEEKLTIQKTLQVTTEKVTNLDAKCEEQKQSISELQHVITTFEFEKEIKDDAIIQLKKRQESLEHEIEVLKRDLTHAQSKCEEEEKIKEKVSKDLNETMSTLKEVEKFRADLKREIKSIKASKSQVEAELREKRLMIEELKDQFEKQNEKEAELRDKLNKDKASLMEMETEKQSLKKENVNFKHKLSEMEHFIKLEKSTNKKKDDEIKRLETIKANCEAKLTKSNEDLLAMNETVKDLETKLKQNDLSLNRLKDEKKEIEEHLVKINSVIRSCLKLGNITINESETTFDEIIPSKQRKSNLLSTLIDSDLLDAEFVRSAMIDLLSKVETLSKEKDDFKMAIETAEKVSNQLKESNKNLKSKIEKLENEIGTFEKEKIMLHRKLEDGNVDKHKLEGLLDKVNIEKKAKNSKLEQIQNLNDKLEKEKRKLIHELNGMKSAKLMAEKDSAEYKERLEIKLKRLENVKETLDAQVSDLIKNCNQLREEKESLSQELKLVNAKLIELQNHNLKLHSALSDSNMALKRCSDSEKELKKKITNLSDNLEQHDSVSKDVNKVVKKLKEQIQDLKIERTTIQSSIQTDRQSMSQMRETIHNLNHKVKQLEAELSLSNIKKKEAEFQHNVLSNSNINKDAQIKELKTEITNLEDKNRKLTLNQKSMERSISLGSVTKTPTLKSAEKVGKGKSFEDEADLSSKGLMMLEQENTKIQNKVKSLQNLMNEAHESSSQTSITADISKLRQAQRQAEELLQIREKTHKKHVNCLENHISNLKEQISVTEIVSTPSTLKSLPRKHDCSKHTRFQATSTPISAASSIPKHVHSKPAVSKKI